MDPNDVRISQEQMHFGRLELESSNLLRPEVYADPAAIMIAVSRVYSAMRRREKRVLPTKEIFIVGAK